MSGTGGDRGPALRWLTGLVADLPPDELPPAILDRYRGAVLDLLAAALLGRDEPSARVFASLTGGDDDGGLLVDSASTAAAAHALELDDVHIDVTGWHPSVAIVSPLLALGRHRPLHGRDLLAGVIAGWEVGGRIGAAITPAHRSRGFHATGTIGALAAAASVGRAVGLDADAMAGAVGLAASMAGGTFGILAGAPETKHLHAAHGVLAGTYAVLLTQAGFRGPAGTLEAPEGFFRAYAGGDVDLDRLYRPLGESWEIERQMVKPHACCGHAFGAIDAAVALRREHPLDVSAIDRVEVHTYDAAAVLTELHPDDPVAARLSVPWCVAQALLDDDPDGLLGMDAFTPAALEREDVHALAAKVEVRPWPESNAAFPAQRRTRVAVPEVGEAAVTYPRGMPENPVGADELRLKFRSLVGDRFGPETVGRLEELVDGLLETPDVVTALDAAVAR
jgi:2-methylcitrate dehydratase PrpD